MKLKFPKDDLALWTSGDMALQDLSGGVLGAPLLLLFRSLSKEAAVEFLLDQIETKHIA